MYKTCRMVILTITTPFVSSDHVYFLSTCHCYRSALRNTFPLFTGTQCSCLIPFFFLSRNYCICFCFSGAITIMSATTKQKYPSTFTIDNFSSTWVYFRCVYWCVKFPIVPSEKLLFFLDKKVVVDRCSELFKYLEIVAFT